MQKDIVKIWLMYIEIFYATAQMLHALKKLWQLLGNVSDIGVKSFCRGVPTQSFRCRHHNAIDRHTYQSIGSDGIVQKGLNCSLSDDLAMVDDDDAIAALLCFVQMMRGQNNTSSSDVQFIQHVKDALSALGVDPYGWFIQKQDAWAMQNPTSDIDSAFHSAGKVSR